MRGRGIEPMVLSRLMIELSRERVGWSKDLEVGRSLLRVLPPFALSWSSS